MDNIGKSLSAAVFLAGSVFSPAVADLSEHFKDRTITVVIPYGPGGTYDKYGSTFANHIGQFLPSKPTVILQHMPGAGGSKAMNYLYSIAPKQGFHMTVPLDNLVINQLLRPKRMKYKADKFNYLGSSNQTNAVLAVRTDSGVKKIMDAKNTQIIGSTSGKSIDRILGIHHINLPLFNVFCESSWAKIQNGNRLQGLLPVDDGYGAG